MKDNKTRTKIKKYCEDCGHDVPVFFDNQDYDNSIIGISTTGVVIYSYSKMIEELSQEYIENGESDEENAYMDAQEWIDYNTLRALPYFSVSNKPIVVFDINDIKEQVDE